jgi:hypothetical protein
MPAGSGLTPDERARLRPGMDLAALDALVRGLPDALRSLVLLRYARDAGSEPWRRRHNAQVAAAGLPGSWQVPEQGEWAMSWSLGGTPQLAELWQAVERSAAR